MLKPIKSVSKLIIAASLMGVFSCPVFIQAVPAPAVAAQDVTTASGVVKDELGDPMIGATVRVVGNASQGSATNIDGEFSIKNVKNGTKLQITSVGYKPIVVVWNGTPLDIDMELNTQQLDEVVVTAMGIQREAKTLTYAAQTIKNDEVTRIKETNFVNALQGKSAGLTITPNNSGAGGGASKIVLSFILTVRSRHLLPLHADPQPARPISSGLYPTIRACLVQPCGSTWPVEPVHLLSSTTVLLTT